jgi:hypothetical protein
MPLFKAAADDVTSPIKRRRLSEFVPDWFPEIRPESEFLSMVIWFR